MFPEDKRDAAAAKRGRELFAPRAEMLSAVLKNHDYPLDSKFSGTDIVIGYKRFWVTFTGLLDGYSVLQAYLGRLPERPAFQRAFSASPS